MMCLVAGVLWAASVLLQSPRGRPRKTFGSYKSASWAQVGAMLGPKWLLKGPTWGQDGTMFGSKLGSKGSLGPLS